ncbi:MAG: conjugative transposon protein TraM [Bacteroidia bacterium]
MEKKSLTPKELRRRKLFLMLPVMALPFLTLFFWAMGGGTVEAAEATVDVKKGFNINLPNPNFKDDKALDKLSYYDNATKDSLKDKAKNERTPDYFENRMAFSVEETEAIAQEPGQKAITSKGLNTKAYRNPSEEKIYKRLEALQKTLNNPPQQPRAGVNPSATARESVNAVNPEIEKLESMMQTMSQPAGSDPELEQLGSMLETIVDIQHPERVQERLKQQSQAERGKVFPVTGTGNPDNVSVLETGLGGYMRSATELSNGFYSLDDVSSNEVVTNAITAVIHEPQTLVNGSVIKLRLTSDVMVNGVQIPQGHFVFGAVSLKGERLTIRIESLRYENSIFQVDLSVYDMDGMEGIYIPGAIARDVAKSSADRSMQSMGVTTIDDSWSSQAAGAGIEAAKTLFSKKVKLIKVNVKAGYQVLLYDEKTVKSKN